MHRASLGARRAFAAAPSQTVVPRVRGDASHRFLPGNVRRLSTQVAALDEPQTADERSQQAVGQSAGAESVAEVRLEELDDAQEQLIAWMMYKDDEQQEADLDEMVDYDEFGDEEYAELYDEVEKLYAEVEYDFKVGDKVTGTVIDIDEDGAYVEIGAKASGFCPLSECSLAKLKTVSGRL